MPISKLVSSLQETYILIRKPTQKWKTVYKRGRYNKWGENLRRFPELYMDIEGGVSVILRKFL